MDHKLKCIVLIQNYKFIKSIDCQNINGCFFIHKIGKINDRFFLLMIMELNYLN